MLEKLFKLTELGTTTKREIIAGCTTFMTLSYIIFVCPNLMSLTGMDRGAAMVATCLAAAGSMFLMAFLANYPIALAPGMGIIPVFVFGLCQGLGLPWQEALGIVFISGVLFILLAVAGVREAVMNAIPRSLQQAIAVGIGLFIAFIGLKMGGIVTAHPATFVTHGKFVSPPVLLALFGVVLTMMLMARNVPGAILIGMLSTGVVSLLFGLVKFEGIVALPPSIAPTAFKLQFPNLFASPELFAMIFVFFFVDMFDSIGTFTAVGHQAGLITDGKLPKARQALLTDAVGSAGGALLGTSTVTSYIESSAGIAAGGRTGLTTIVTGLLMLVALFFEPLVSIVGDPVGEAGLNPAIAPALIIVGSLMIKGIATIEWDDLTEAVPAFLTLVMMPLAFSVTEGIAFGFIAYAFMKLVTGRAKEAHWLIYLFAVLFIALYFIR